jgi:hypothetical protein
MRVEIIVKGPVPDTVASCLASDRSKRRHSSSGGSFLTVKESRARAILEIVLRKAGARVETTDHNQCSRCQFSYPQLTAILHHNYLVCTSVLSIGKRSIASGGWKKPRHVPDLLS